MKLDYKYNKTSVSHTIYKCTLFCDFKVRECFDWLVQYYSHASMPVLDNSYFLTSVRFIIQRGGPLDC